MRVSDEWCVCRSSPLYVRCEVVKTNVIEIHYEIENDEYAPNNEHTHIPSPGRKKRRELSWKKEEDEYGMEFKAKKRSFNIIDGRPLINSMVSK